MTAAASLASASAYCTCSFQAARPNTRAHGQRRLAVTSQATHEAARNRALAAGLALVASVPLVLSGSANAFVGNTAKDFSDKVNRYTPSPGAVTDAVSSKVEQVTPDVPLPGLKQKGKEAEAIGKLKGPQSGPGAADQVKGAAGDVADKAGDVSKGALGDTPKPKGGLFGRINEEALTKNSPSKQISK
ncbi:hypothetical protein WJX79_008824 [Trebouxia sp. C0005]